MTKDNPKKLSQEERRRQLYFKKWGVTEKNSTGDLRSDMRVWVAEADKEKAAQEKKNKSVKAISIDVDGITRSRLEYARNNNFEEPEKGIGELLNKKEQQ